MLDCFGCEGGNVAAEVCYGEEEALGLGHGDADDVKVWIEKVGAVGWAGDPGLMECGNAVAMSGDVFRDGAEACSGGGSAGGEIGFAGILVEEFAGVADNPLEMSTGGAGK
jgi:hypothetical protein